MGGGLGTEIVPTVALRRPHRALQPSTVTCVPAQSPGRAAERGRRSGGSSPEAWAPAWLLHWGLNSGSQGEAALGPSTADEQLNRYHTHLPRPRRSGVDLGGPDAAGMGNPL